MSVKPPGADVVLTSDTGSELRRRLVSAFRELAMPPPACEVSTFDTVATLLGSVRPLVLVVDVAGDWPRARGLLMTLRRSAPAVLVLVLGDPDAECEIAEAIKLGAGGHCARHDERTIVRAIVALRGGDAWFSRRLMRDVIEDLSGHGVAAATGPLARLTSRERDVCAMVAGGVCNKEIGVSLRISDKTVKNHLTAIFRKLGVGSRLELALAVSRTRFAHPAVAGT